MHEAVVAEIASTGTLRVAINLANFLLVTGRSESGDPQGVAPDFAREIANSLDVPLTLVPYAMPDVVAAAVDDNAWDIALIGAEPARAATIAFTPAYVEIAASYLVPAGSALMDIAAVDQPGVRIAVCGGAAYDLWLTRHIVHAEILRAPSIPAAFQLFVDEKLDALAGLQPGLLANADHLPGARILDGNFTTIQQAVGTARGHHASITFLAGFVEQAKRSGLVAALIERHRVRGLSVAQADA